MAAENEMFKSLALATALRSQGDSAGAVKELVHAEQLARAAGDMSFLATVLIQKAGWLREMGYVGEAGTLREQVEQILASLPREENLHTLTFLRMEQGIATRSDGNAARSEQLLREAEQEAHKHPWGVAILSDILVNLGSTLIDEGKLDQAQTALGEAVANDRQIGNTRALANDLNILAILYGVIGDRVTEQLYLEQSLQIATEGGFLKEAADALGNYAITLENAGQLDAAREGYEQARKIYESMGNQREAANMYSSLGIVSHLQGDLPAALRLHEKAYQLHSETGQRDMEVRDLINLSQLVLNMKEPAKACDYARNAVQLAEANGQLEILWATHFLLARAATAYAGVDAEHRMESITNDVMPSYAKAIDAIEILRTGIGRAEEREYFLGDKEQVYDEAVIAYALLGQAKGTFAFSERARARAFLDVMGSERLEHTAAQHPLAQRRQELTRQLLDIDGSDPKKAQAIFQELHLLRSQIIADAPAIAAVTEAQMPNLEKIAAAIPEKTALIEFYIAPNRTLFTFVVTSEGLVDCIMVPLKSIDLPAKIAQFRAELEYGVEGVPTGGELWAILFEPIFKRIWPMVRLLIVPHRELHYIPFSALWFQLQNREGQFYMCQRFGHSILPSAAFLPLCLALPRTPLQSGRSRVLGNPTGDLPYAAEEAKQVASLLGSSPLLGPEATRAAFLDAPRDLAVIHVASHGEQNEIDPLLSRLLLADGSATVEDIMESHLSTGLLTLSGCVTGMARRQAGDELIGLSRAASLAGVPSIITALWNIWDDTSSAFFDYFYFCLMKGMAKDEALWQTQLAFLSTEEYSHPMYWAPFILLGDWN
jgi:CHAT domain-containing protein